MQELHFNPHLRAGRHTVARCRQSGFFYFPLKGVRFCSWSHLIWGLSLIPPSLKAFSEKVWTCPQVLPFWSLGWVSARGLGQGCTTMTGWNAPRCQLHDPRTRQ